jgi:pimeloyl-ACP methyl ester carboxylesterase
MGRRIMSWIAIAAALLIGVPAAFYLLQDRLLFYPQSLAGPPPATSGDRMREELELATPDGVRLRGWLLKAAAPRAPILLYYGGNAEQISWQARARTWPPAWSLALVHYRGYGGSEGSPSEQHLFADALLVYDALVQRADVDASRIVLVGRSLGSGVAAFVAAERPVRGVILISPYDSITEVARRHYPWLPVRLLLRHPFDSHARAPGIQVPLVVIAGGRDDIIPPSHSRRLFDAWSGPKRWLEIPQADHHDLSAYPAFEQTLQEWLRERLE